MQCAVKVEQQLTLVALLQPVAGTGNCLLLPHLISSYPGSLIPNPLAYTPLPPPPFYPLEESLGMPTGTVAGRAYNILGQH